MDPVVIDNFISKESCRRLTEFLDPMLKPSPRVGMRGALGYETSAEASAVGDTVRAVKGYEGTPQEEIVFELEGVYASVQRAMEQHFNIEMSLVNCSYQELTEGGENPMHSDSTKLDGSPWRDDGIEEELEFSALVYFSDYGSDFAGGEIEFPLQNVTVYPKAGQLVFFRGDVEHIHEVKKVTGGVRKNLVFFLSRKGNVSSIKYFEDAPTGHQ